MRLINFLKPIKWFLKTPLCTLPPLPAMGNTVVLGDRLLGSDVRSLPLYSAISTGLLLNIGNRKIKI